MGTLQSASQSQDPALLLLRTLYESTFASLSEKASARLLRILAQVEDTCCYDDGIAALQSPEKTREQGLAKHMSSLPFDCKTALNKWIEEQPKLYTPMTSQRDPAHYLQNVRVPINQL
jgi:hypothetical protein